MKPDPFERAFRQLPWRKPQASLKDRIFSADSGSAPSVVQLLFSRPIALGWAAALIAGAGMIGYSLGRLDSPTPASPLLGQAELRIIESGSTRNFFDLSPEPLDPWPGKLNLDTRESTESSG